MKSDSPFPLQWHYCPSHWYLSSARNSNRLYDKIWPASILGLMWHWLHFTHPQLILPSHSALIALPTLKETFFYCARKVPPI